MATLGEKVIGAEGPSPARLLVFGGCPSKRDEENGVPLSGTLGTFLDRFVLRKVPLDRSGVRVSNVVPYRCCDKNGEDAHPSITQIRANRGRVEEEIASTAPRVILAMGNEALHALLPVYNKEIEEDEQKSTGVTGINKWAGKVVWSRDYNCWVVPTYHPRDLYADFYGDGTRFNRGMITWRIKQSVGHFKQALRLSKKSLPRQVYPEGVLVKTEREALGVLDQMLSSAFVALDTESAGLDPRSRFLGFSLCNEATVGYYVGRELLTVSVLKKLSVLISSQKVVKALHNGAHDGPFLQAHGLPVLRNWVDTMLAASLVDENFPKGLKPLALRYLNFGGYDRELEEYKQRNRINSYEDIPDDVLGPYGAYDAPATYQLWRVFEPIMEREGTLDFFYKLMMPTRFVLNKVQVNGFRVNREHLEWLDSSSNKALRSLEKLVYEEAGHEFNIRSNKQLQNVLFKEIGLKPVKKTETGYSCDEESLKKIAKQSKSKVVQYLLDIRYIHTIQNHFLTKILSAVGEDGRVRAKYNSVGTVTGRTSCTSPPLHNIPRDRLVRTLFVASPGNVLVVMDIKSAELRALAAYCQDPNLLRAFAENQDLHVETYKLMFNKSSDYVPTDSERQIGKTINFALVFRETIFGLARQLGVPVEKADEYLRLYFKKFPTVKGYMDETIAFCKQEGYVQTLLGRRRHIPEAYADDPRVLAHAERQMINSRVQGLANDVTNIAMVRLDSWYNRKGLGALIVHNVHDSIVTDVSEEHVDVVRDFNQRAVRMGVPGVNVAFDCDVDIERAWGEHKEESKLEECFLRAGVIKKPKKARRR